MTSLATVAAVDPLAPAPAREEPSPASPASAEAAGLAAQLDGLGLRRLHLVLLACCTFGFAFDLYEIGIGNALAAVFSAAPHRVPPQQLAWLLASLYVGATVGAPAFGWLADRLGRRKVLCLLLGLMGLSAAVASMTQSVAQLAVVRALMGTTVGAFPPVLFAYLTDLLPPARRGSLLFLMTAVAFLGAPAGIFLMRGLGPEPLLGLDAWRWTLIAGAAGALLCAALLARMPESPRWLAAKGRFEAAQAGLQRFSRSRPVGRRPSSPQAAGVQAGTAPLRAGPGGRRPVVPLLWLLFLLSPWATVAFPLLSGAVLSSKGIRLSDTLLFVGLSTFGPVLGTLASAHHIDAVGRRLALGGCALAMGIAGAAFVSSSSATGFVLASGAFSVFAAIFVPTLTTYAAELFPTGRRAGALAGCWAFNRAGAAMAPLVLLPLLASQGASAMMAVIAGTLAAATALLLLLPGGREGQAVA